MRFSNSFPRSGATISRNPVLYVLVRPQSGGGRRLPQGHRGRKRNGQFPASLPTRRIEMLLLVFGRFSACAVIRDKKHAPRRRRGACFAVLTGCVFRQLQQPGHPCLYGLCCCPVPAAGDWASGRSAGRSSGPPDRQAAAAAAEPLRNFCSKRSDNSG